jgi:hypothetical protein
LCGVLHGRNGWHARCILVIEEVHRRPIGIATNPRSKEPTVNVRRYRNPVRPLFIALTLAIGVIAALLPTNPRQPVALAETVKERDALTETAVRMRWLLTAPHASSRRCCGR